MVENDGIQRTNPEFLVNLMNAYLPKYSNM